MGQSMGRKRFVRASHWIIGNPSAIGRSPASNQVRGGPQGEGGEILPLGQKRAPTIDAKAPRTALGCEEGAPGSIPPIRHISYRGERDVGFGGPGSAVFGSGLRSHVFCPSGVAAILLQCMFAAGKEAAQGQAEAG